MSIFRLPDLGEGLQEAEIAEWHVQSGQEIALHDRLVSVETAKAIVEIPSPRAGRIRRLYGEAGDVLAVGAPLVEFEGGAEEVKDAGTVVGRVEATSEVLKERPTNLGRADIGVRATPAVRALARRLNVDLSVVTPSGRNETVTVADVERVARIFKEVGPLEPLRGVRRAMAHSMTQAHAEIAAVTVVEDADLAAWSKGEVVMLRLIRAIVAGCTSVPALNAWYDTHAVGRRVLDKIHLGVAVDTDDGLFVPVLHDIGNRDREDLRRGLEAMKSDVRARTIPPEELRGFTITLSNFGVYGGRYANPVVVPPSVAILGAGRMRDQVVAFEGKAVVHRVLPLSLTFDHRAVTGGEATRFLMAVIDDLQRSE
jgi:2-oxoisovalerate dehydrogenase E2 component (dihydrolipoyl transacylase)